MISSEAVTDWHKAGCYVLPVKTDGSKSPAVRSWDTSETATQTHQDVTALFSGAINTDGVGLVCGAASGHLELLECEARVIHEGLTNGLSDALLTAGLEDLWMRLSQGYVETTPSGGVHWLFRTEGPSRRNLKLARRPGPTGPEVLWETRGQGGFVVVAPSAGRTHPSGAAWTTIVGTPASIPTISTDERDHLYAVVSSLDESPPPDTPTHPTTPYTGDEQRPGDDYNQRANWRDILTPHGWRLVKPLGRGLAWQRPGKTGPGISATTGMSADADRLFVFSSSVQDLPTETPVSKFAAYALLNHGGDYAAAASQLRKDGYGAPMQHRDPWDWTDLLPQRAGDPATQQAVAQPANGETGETGEDYGGRLTDGGVFLFDSPANPEPVWGDGSEILWSRGEPCIITGPIGAGKTTLLGRLVHASLALSGSVLDYTVAPTERVLYLASDRPRQIARNLRRMFDPADRDEIADKLVVWQGPPPVDVAKNPGILLELAQAAHATRVFVDGVKDIAAKISEEETGQGLNRAFQLLTVAGIDVAANHHQRKGEGGKLHRPKTLDDVYGSTWLAAGAGTVLLLWADEAGAQSVELSTIKPAADIVGPLLVIHETDRGTFELDSSATAEDGPLPLTKDNITDALKRRAHTTMTAKEIAEMLGHKEAKKAKNDHYSVRRIANRLVAAGLVKRIDHERPDRPGSAEQHFKWLGETRTHD